MIPGEPDRTAQTVTADARLDDQDGAVVHAEAVSAIVAVRGDQSW
jgi:hypothetical protein